MKASVLALSLLSASAAGAAEPAPAPSPAADPALPLRLRLTEEAIRQAVRETLAERRDSSRPMPEGDALSGDPYHGFAREFEEARKPSCLAPDALKHQPSGFTTKNWNFGVGGLLALPFWAAAIARGKCN